MSESLHIPAEWQTLAQCLRCAIHSEPPPPVIARTDWGALLRQARGHCVECFLYPWLSRYLPEQFSVRAAIAADSAQAAWRSIALENFNITTTVRRPQIAEILKNFSAAGIRVIPLKGAWLSEAIYDEPSQRQMVDIDLLVSRDAVEDAQRILTASGYTTSGCDTQNEFSCDTKFYHPQSPFFVELHWNVESQMTGSLSIPDMTPIQNRSTAATLYGHPVRKLRTEDLICHLVQHILHHQFALPLKSYVDLALILLRSAESIDPQMLELAAADWKTGRAVPFVLTMVQRLFATPVPPKMESLLETDDTALVQDAWSAVFDLPQAKNRTRETYLLKYREMSPGGRIKLILQRIFMPRNYMILHHPCAKSPWLLPVAWFMRAVTLARQTGGTLLHQKDYDTLADNASARRNLIKKLLAETAEPQPKL